MLGCVVQSVTCLTADLCLTADPVVVSSTPARSHTFLEINHEIISTAILLPSPDHEIISMFILLPSPDSRRVVVSYKQKYVHEVLINRLVKFTKGKKVIR